MKKYLILLAIMLMGNVARADGHALKVTLAGGTAATYILTSRPVVSYSGGNMTIRNASLEDSYPLGQVESLTFVEDVTSIRTAAGGENIYCFRDNVFTCEGNEIRVYDLAGAIVSQGADTVSLRGLPAGVYIVNVAGRSIKVLKK